jgi:hypothetical protein
MTKVFEKDVKITELPGVGFVFSLGKYINYATTNKTPALDAARCCIEQCLERAELIDKLDEDMIIGVTTFTDTTISIHPVSVAVIKADIAFVRTGVET